MKRRGRKTGPGSRELRAAKMRLDEGVRVDLDPDSSFDTQPETVKETGEASAIGDAGTPPEFDTTSSSILSELRAILADLNQSPESEGWEGSDPNLTSMLVNLVGDPEEKIPNPFLMSDRVRNELVARAEQAGARAMSWDMTQFDKIGGRGTLTTVWNRLKGCGLVGGVKRPASDSSTEGEDSKKLKISLNISGLLIGLMILS